MDLRTKLRAIAQGVHTKLVEAPEWGALFDKADFKIEVRRLNVAMQGVWRTFAADPSLKLPEGDDAEFPALVKAELSERNLAALVVACSFDPETNERVFEAEDVETLLNLPPEHKAVIDRILDAAIELNAFGKEASKDAANFSTTSPKSERSSGSGSKAASRPRS